MWLVSGSQKEEILCKDIIHIVCKSTDDLRKSFRGLNIV